MKKVVKIIRGYASDNGIKTLKDGFTAFFDNGEKMEISDTDWETANKKTAVDNGLIYHADDIFFSNKMIDEINRMFGNGGAAPTHSRPGTPESTS